MKTSKSLLLATFSTVLFLTPSSSEDNWIDIGSDTLYLFGGSASFEFANIICRSKGSSGRLADINSDLTSIKLTSYAQSDDGIGFWIGLMKDESGEFKRIGGQQSGYFNWYGSAASKDNDNMDCVVVFTSDMKWHVDYCSFTWQYLCAIDKEEIIERSKNIKESDIIRKSDSTGSADNWIDIGSDTLYFFGGKASFWDANFICENKGNSGRLADIDSGLTSMKLIPYVQSDSIAFWIGIKKDASGEFKRIGGQQNGYFNWHWSVLDDLNDTEDCVLVDPSDMKWHDFKCTTVWSYLCAIDKAEIIERKSEILPNSTAEVIERKSEILSNSTGIASDCHAIVTALSFLSVLVFFW